MRERESQRKLRELRELERKSWVTKLRELRELERNFWLRELREHERNSWVTELRELRELERVSGLQCIFFYVKIPCKFFNIIRVN